MKRLLLLIPAMLLATQAGAASKRASAKELATPAGITLRTVTVAKGVNTPVEYLVFADEQGRTLYTSDADAPKKSTCSDECTQQWRPALAVAGARAPVDWALIRRKDGGKQWTYRDRPLYTCAKDRLPSETAGDYSDSQYVMARGALCDDQDGRHIARFAPGSSMTLPASIVVTEVLTAPGMVLTSDDGMPLYAFSGKAEAAAKLGTEWIPFRAPQAALAVGKFRPLAGSDGIEQWSYDEKPLYRYRGDLQQGDSNGKSVDPNFQLITVRRYFMPEEVAIRADQRRGGVLVTAKEQRTLYARERTRQDRAGNHGARGGDRGELGTGQLVGLIGCDARCEQTRVPLIAPANAKASGYWTVLKREDGRLQWAYQGYALYSYLGEEPGKTTGYDVYDFVVNHDTKNLAPANQRMGFYWRVSSP